MRILFLGDVVGKSGCLAVNENLPDLIKKKKIDEKKQELKNLSNKFRELKSLVYEYKEEKEQEINKLINEQNNFKK